MRATAHSPNRVLHIPESALAEAITTEVEKCLAWTPIEIIAVYEGESLARDVIRRLRETVDEEESAIHPLLAT